MRLCQWLGLAALCLLALSLRTTADRAHAQAAAPGGAGAARGQYPTWEVKRYGETADDARDLALAAACDEVASYFRRDVPAIGDWTPSQDSLQKKNVISLMDVPQLKQIEKPQPDRPEGREAFEARVKVEITPKSLEELSKEAREGRMQDRQSLLARLLAGAVALLLVTTGYLRLEDATRGYYTTLLRLTALGAVAAVGVVLWLVA
jgi:hypothetical protein